MSIEGEKRIRSIREAGKKRTIKYLRQVAGENYAEKINIMVNDLDLPYRQIARELGVCVAELRSMLKAINIDRVPKKNEENVSVPHQNQNKEPEINIQNLPKIEAARQALQMGKIDKINAARWIVLHPYKGEDPSLRDTGKIFGVSQEAIRLSRNRTEKILKEEGLI